MELLNMNLKTSLKGIQFYEPDVLDKNKGIVLYLCGGGNPSENPLNSTFVREFVVAHKDKFQCFAGILPSGRTGWDFTLDEAKTLEASSYLARYIKDTYPYNGNFTYTGFSAGASIIGVNDSSDFVTNFVLCAGGGPYSMFASLGRKNIPARWYHAIDDGAISISKAREYSKVYGSAMQLIEIPKGGHGAAPAVAFDTNSDLATWIMNKSNPVEPPENSGMDIPIKRAYLSESKNRLVIEFENGKVWEYPPPN